MVEIHFDLETGALKPDAAIYSIGAVAIRRGKMFGSFHIRMNPNQRGRRRDNIHWWDHANPAEYAEICKSQVKLRDGLRKFAEWLGQYDIEKYWQLRFQDFMWLEHAYGQQSMECPIRYSNVRELHTFMEAKNAEYPIRESGSAHNALADAKYQAEAWMYASGQPNNFRG